MPALTINTDTARARSPSPARPPVSPITPTLPSTRLPGDQPPRQTLAHSQPDQVGIPPPAPLPLEFDSNPDVIALKSAISILQLQRQRATADIQTLSRAKDEAINDPEAFIRDLANKQSNLGAAKPGASHDDDDDDNDQSKPDNQSQGFKSQGQTTGAKEWQSLPKPQDVVRCPPINWSQYAIVGDSLHKIHAEQVANPSQGTPAVIGPNGSYEFKGEGKQEKYIGVAAPYAPGRDMLANGPRDRGRSSN